VTAPNLGPIQGADQQPTPIWRKWIAQVASVADAAQQNGTTAQRPTSGLWIGRPYFDTTLGYEVFYDGSTWVGGAGGGGGGAPTTAQYVTLATDAGLSAERVLTAGAGISITDGGANGPVTVACTVSAGVPTSRLINTTAPLAGGGDLTADRTLSVATFGAGASGVVPASGGGTSNFLRADGSWTAPAGGSGYPSALGYSR